MQILMQTYKVFKEYFHVIFRRGSKSLVAQVKYKFEYNDEYIKCERTCDNE